LRSCLPSVPDQDVVIDDVLAIILGMVDAAGVRGESLPDALAQRVLRAVMGYLATADSRA
jgi:hypothetical protein